MASMRTFFVLLALVLVTVFLLAEYRLVQPGIYKEAIRGLSMRNNAVRSATNITSAPQPTPNAFHKPTQLEEITSVLATRNGTMGVNLTDAKREYSGRSVAMGCAITTRKIPTAKDMIKSLPFFKHLLPSFCRTASPDYLYMFYMGYDFNDPILSTVGGKEAFEKFFRYVTLNECKGNFKVDFKYVKCDYSAKPAWSQNDALLAGYRDGMDYYYMVNDDTIMVTNQWTRAFIKELETFTPPNVGLVGPTHSGGNVAILTYHFTHRTHIDIFKYFYPRNFTDWFGDDWISKVYEPNNVKKIKLVTVKHTLEKGQRYKHHPQMRGHLKGILEHTKKYLRTYLEEKGVIWDDWVKPKATPAAKTKAAPAAKDAPAAKAAPASKAESTTKKKTR